MAGADADADAADDVASQPAAGPAPRPAATVMLVRDGGRGPDPLEVLMVRRNLRSAFVAGAHVFPGGAVDPDDGGPRAARACPQLSDAEASERLGLDAGGLAYWVAALRECFEETGLLLGTRGPGGPALSFADAADAADAARFAAHRRELNAARRGFLDICEEEGITLAVDELHYFSHWLTPQGAPRRYDTRFFVGRAPADQTPAHDATETIAEAWVRPADALAANLAGTMDLLLPTIRSLEAIGSFATADDLLAAVPAMGRPPALLPRMVAGATGVRLVLPGEPGYDGAPAPPLTDHFGAGAFAASRAANRGAAPAGHRPGAAAPVGDPHDPCPAGESGA